jgi:hypothetical protein
MFWQSPAQFNDPFDCKPVWVFEASSAARKAFFGRVVRST